MQLPLTIYLLEGFFARIPQDLFDAARIDGYGDFEIFWRIAFPIAMPAIVTTTILNFILLWNEFLYAVVLITTTTSERCRSASRSSWAISSQTSEWWRPGQ